MARSGSTQMATGCTALCTSLWMPQVLESEGPFERPRENWSSTRKGDTQGLPAEEDCWHAGGGATTCSHPAFRSSTDTSAKTIIANLPHGELPCNGEPLARTVRHISATEMAPAGLHRSMVQFRGSDLATAGPTGWRVVVVLESARCSLSSCSNQLVARA